MSAPIVGPEIKRFLESRGKNQSGGLLYQVVWSDDQFEYRHGTFNDFYGDIFIRSYTGVRYAPKYNYIRERFILEKWFPPALSRDERLPESDKGSYEPLFVFQDKNGNALAVTLWAVEIIVYFDSKARENQASLVDKRIEELKDTKEFSELYDAIDVSDIQSLLHSKEAIIRP